jgi:hypothetical protein
MVVKVVTGIFGIIKNIKIDINLEILSISKIPVQALT